MGLTLTTWNIGWFGQLLKGMTRTLPMHSKKVTSASGKALQKLQRLQITEEIRRINPDVLCIQEGPSTGNIKALQDFCEKDLDGEWVVVERQAGDIWHIRGSQGIFFLVKAARVQALEPRLLAQSAWFESTEIESRVDITKPGTGEHNKKWPIIHPLFKPVGSESLEEPGDDDDEAENAPELHDREHSHYRHPQVLVLTIDNRRVDIIGCHLKSKFGGDDYVEAGQLRQRPEASLSMAQKN